MNQVTNESSGVSDPPPVRAGRRLHPLPVRVMHWINAVATLVMITSGWGIYDDDEIIRGFHFSQFWQLGRVGGSARIALMLNGLGRPRWNGVGDNGDDEQHDSVLRAISLKGKSRTGTVAGEEPLG